MNITKKFYIFIFLVFLPSYLVSENNPSKEMTNVMGDLNAPNILIEYASLSCVHCANFHNDRLPKIKENLINTGKLKYIYKDFPLDLPAMLAAMVAHCYQGDQYYAILNTLFKNQKKWVSGSKNKKELYNKFYKILKQHGITLENISICADDSDKNKQKWESILTSRLEGQKLGVNSTPSFFLNGKKLDGLVDLKLLLKHIY